jgi:putative chitinase
MLITPDQLNKVTDTLSPVRCNVLAEMLNDACARYGVSTMDEFDEFLANLLQESGECSHKTENMSYSAARLPQVWPGRFNASNAQAYARQPEKLANFVYGGRMGNNQPGDGWRFRGGGYIGLTGREVYSKYAAYIGKEIGEAADLVRSQDYYALDSAFWFFYVLKGLKDESIRDEWVGIVKSINGGTVGMKTREYYYNRIKALV